MVGMPADPRMVAFLTNQSWQVSLRSATVCSLSSFLLLALLVIAHQPVETYINTDLTEVDSKAYDCEFDSNCCQGMECKMEVDRTGLKSVCLSKYADPDEPPIADDYEDFGWSFNRHDQDLTSNVEEEEEEEEAIHATLKEIKEKERQTLDNNINLIQELRKPLTFEELKELTQLKELDDLKKQQELKQLREWTKNHERKEMLKKERQKVLEQIAKERVEQVLKEEEKQKLEIFKEMIKNDKGIQTQL